MQLDDLIRRVSSYAESRVVGDKPLATPVRGLSVMYSRAPTALAHMIYAPVFCLVLQGAKQAVVGDRNLTFGRMESLIVSVELPAVSRIVKASAAAPYVALAVTVDLAIVRELIAQGGVDTPVGSGQAAATLAADEEILDAMRRLFALVDKPKAARVLQPLIVREIHYWLLSSAHGAMLRSLGQADSHSSRVARTISAIRKDYAKPLRIAELANLAGMSMSAFHAHFRSVTGTTPLQFQKRLKLSEARRLLMTREFSVSSVAYKVGYESATQFSREYARQFGAPPREDLRSAGRQSAAQA